MDADQLASWLESKLPGIPELNLSRDTRVTHVFNWGGFVNQSFFINDGRKQYHVKLTNDAGITSSLERWSTFHQILESRYRAPKLFRRLVFPEIGFSGLLFEHVNGKTADFHNRPELLQKLIELARCLHEDEDLSLLLAQPKTCLDHFTETYIHRFTADLETIESAQLPFISESLFHWMQDEMHRLQESATLVPSFHQAATAPVHGDLHEGNILVTENNWFVLDWDDLAIGDPAIDLAILVWPKVWQGEKWQRFLPQTDPALAERIEVCLRAQLLDEVIDPLADYTEAHQVPTRQAEVQQAKRQRHEEALAKYVG